MHELPFGLNCACILLTISAHAAAPESASKSDPAAPEALRLNWIAANQFVSTPAVPAADSVDSAVAEWKLALSATAPGAVIDLREQRRGRLSDGRRVVVGLRQFCDGAPVECGSVCVLVTLEPAPQVTYAAGQLVRSTPAPASDRLDAAAARQALMVRVDTQTLRTWADAEMVVYCGPEGQSLPRRAWRITGTAGAAAGVPEKRTFFIDAASGEVLGARSEVLEADVYGNVLGLVTPGTLPDSLTNPPFWAGVGSIVAASSIDTAVSDPAGAFVLDNGGAPWLDVSITTAHGASVTVVNMAGPNLLAYGTMIPGVSNTVYVNGAPTPLMTAQLNAFVCATAAHDFFRSRSDFAAIDVPVIAKVNQTGMCNANFDGAINFYQAQAGCTNSAYSTLVAHEYGHYIVANLGLGQGGFGEGFADSLAMLLYQTPVIGAQFYSDGSPMRVPGTDGRQYPCNGEIHYCGELLAGVWWDIRQNLCTHYGVTAGQERAAQLFVDWAQITAGGSGANFVNSATPQTAVEVLTVDDDDDDLSNGTPDYVPIAAAFAAHGITAPPAPTLAFHYPNGLPCAVVPYTTTIIPIALQSGLQNPQDGTAAISYSLNGGFFQSIDLQWTAPNQYVAYLPAVACGTRLRYYFSARATDGSYVTDPPAGPGGPYIVTSANAVRSIFSDDMESNRGWISGAAGDTATAGFWERGIPQATAAQPGSDHTANGVNCWITGAAAGSSPSANDVDNGITTLLSPVFDLSQTSDALISYWRWYSNNANSEAPNADVFEVDVTNDLVHWVAVEQLGPTGTQTSGGWYSHQFRLSDFVPPSASVRLRFVAADLGGSSVIEAAVDDLVLTGFVCTTNNCAQSGCENDLNGDCRIDLGDLVALLANFGNAATWSGGDLNADGQVTLGDLTQLLSLYGRDCR